MIDLPGEYSLIISFNMADLCPFDPGGDSRTNPFEERGNDAIQKLASCLFKFKLIQEDVTNQMAIGSTILDKDVKNVTNFIWAANGDSDQVLGLES